MDNTFDKIFYGEGELIGGLDEVGVIDVAGPLVAACVILPKLDVHKDDLQIFKVDDSKNIHEKYRKEHAEVIWRSSVAVGIGEVTPSEIDYLGKSAASSLAMVRAVLACKTPSKGKPVKPHFLLVDGNRPIPLDVKQVLVNSGDNKSLCVAAASILAKVYRDEMMIKLHKSFPAYDWENNKGFPCESHFRGLDEEGLQIGIHRIKFWPFIPQQHREKNRVYWMERRERWRKTTEAKLGRELGGKLWTTNPPLWTPSTNSNALKSLILAAGTKSKDSKSRSK